MLNVQKCNVNLLKIAPKIALFPVIGIQFTFWQFIVRDYFIKTHDFPLAQKL